MEERLGEGMEEARGNEEREKREDEKGSHCFLSPQDSGHDKLELKHQNLVFSCLLNAFIKMSCNKLKSLS